MEHDSAQEDRLLMQRVAAGQASAFHRLVDKYNGRALRAMRRYLGNHAAAEDAVQEAFTVVWQQAARWRPEAPFSAWFYGILYNMARRQQRDRLARSAMLDAAWADPQPGPEHRLQHKERDRALDNALLNLPPRQRMAVILFYIEELDQQVACQAMGIKLGAFESLLSRARLTLRRTLATFDG